MALAAIAAACEEDMDYGEYVLNTRDYVDQTFDGVTNLANNVYNYLDYDYGQMYGGGMLASATDEAVCAYQSNTVQGFTNGSWSATNTLSSRWSNDYTGIQCANYYIDNFGGMTFDELKLNSDYNVCMRRYLYSFQEVRALRAYYYLDLVRNFGDVPYFTRTVDNSSVNSLTRTPALAVLDSIMAECDAVVDTVVEDYSALPDEGWGDKYTLRVDRYFVLALKARAALYAASPLFNTTGDRERWRKAAVASKQLIDECAAKGRTLDAKYSNVASAFALESKEVIFSRLVYSSLTTAIKENYNYPVGINGAGQGINCPSQTLVDAYEMAATGLLPSEAGSGYDAANPYDGRDPRFYLTVACNGDIWPTAYQDTTGSAPYQLQTYIGGNSGQPVTGATPTGYYLKKGLDGTLDFRTGSTGVASSKHSWTTFRLGEFYLNFAEAAYNYTGDPNAAVDGMTANQAVNAVRARAGMPDFPATLAGDDWMRKYKNERMVELAFEGHRFYDLRRWRGASDGVDAARRMTSVDVMEITKNADGTFAYNRKTLTRTWNDRMYLFPIAQSELVKNPNLVQNPGW